MPLSPGILYDRALDRIAELGYVPGSRLWDEFWHGHRERSRNWKRPALVAENLCPVPNRGRAVPYREAWLHGWGHRGGA